MIDSVAVRLFIDNQSPVTARYRKGSHIWLNSSLSPLTAPSSAFALGWPPCKDPRVVLRMLTKPFQESP